MGFANSIVLFLAGVIGASGLIMDRYPKTRSMVEGLRKFHLPVGVIAFVLGVINMISLLNIGMPMIRWVLVLCVSGTLMALGILEGYSTIQDMFKKNPELSARTKSIRDKLWNYQESIGVVAIVLSVLNLIFGH